MARVLFVDDDQPHLVFMRQVMRIEAHAPAKPFDLERLRGAIRRCFWLEPR